MNGVVEAIGTRNDLAICGRAVVGRGRTRTRPRCCGIRDGGGCGFASVLLGETVR